MTGDPLEGGAASKGTPVRRAWVDGVLEEDGLDLGMKDSVVLSLTSSTRPGQFISLALTKEQALDVASRLANRASAVARRSFR